jgi:hypothetical protein
MPADVFRGKVTRVDAEGVWLQIPALGSDLEFGPSSTVTDIDAMVPGALVLVATVTGTFEDVVVVGTLEQDITGAFNGSRWRTGAAVPDDAVGSDGDFYLRNNGDYYERVSGHYVLRGSILGPVSTTPGPTGPQGIAGDTVYNGDRNFLKNNNLEQRGIGGSTNELANWNDFWSVSGCDIFYESDLTKVRSGLGCARAFLPDSTVVPSANPFTRLGSNDYWTVVEGEIVTLVAWVKADVAAAANIGLALFTNASPTVPDFFTTPASTINDGGNNPVPTTWTKITATIKVPAGHNLGRVYFTITRITNAAVTVWIDDIAMYREAAPSGAALKLRTLAQRLQSPMMGGSGIRYCEISAGVGQVWWDNTLTIQNIGRGTDTLPTGVLALQLPVNGVVINGYGGAANQTVAGSRIPLPSGTTLYYEHPMPGGAFSSLNYRIVGHSSDFEVPPWWIPIVTFDSTLTPNFLWYDNDTWGDCGGATAVFNGPWSATAPPNGTTGGTFTIQRPGTYLLEADASGYTTGASACIWYDYIDGVLQRQRGHYFNAVSSHMQGPRRAWTQKLAAGTHYWYQRWSGASDANDTAQLTWTRI